MIPAPDRAANTHRRARYCQTVVTGTIITMIGVVLMRVGVNWAGGGAGKADFGAAGYLAVAALVLAIILLVIKFTRGFLQNVAVLIGITVGYLVTIALGWTDFSGIAEEPIVRVVMPLQFGVPQFFLIPSLTMCLVVMIVFIEATGMFLALGAMTGSKVDAEDVKRGLRADSLGTVIGAIFNTFPYVSYSQNIGLVGVTGVYSRWVCVTGGVIMLVLGLIRSSLSSSPRCRNACSAAPASSCSAWWRRPASRSWRQSITPSSATACWWSPSRLASA